MKRGRPSRLLARLIGHDKREAEALATAIAKDATEVRKYVEQNLLYGVSCLELAPSEHAFGSVVSALRVAKLSADATGKTDLVRVIDGCEGALKSILRRHEAGEMRATGLELVTLSGACRRVTEALPEFSDGDLVLAFELDRTYRKNQLRGILQLPRRNQKRAA